MPSTAPSCGSISCAHLGLQQALGLIYKANFDKCPITLTCVTVTFRNKKSKPCLKWTESQPLSSNSVPVNHPPLLEQLRVSLPGATAGCSATGRFSCWWLATQICSCAFTTDMENCSMSLFRVIGLRLPSLIRVQSYGLYVVTLELGFRVTGLTRDTRFQPLSLSLAQFLPQPFTLGCSLSINLSSVFHIIYLSLYELIVWLPQGDNFCGYYIILINLRTGPKM